MDQGGVDLSDRSLFRAGFPHELFAQLRREAPVWRHPDTPGVRESVGEPGFWVVSTMDLVRRVARDEETFSAVEGSALRRFGPAWQGISLVSVDGAAHRRLRGLINRGFTPRMIGRLEEQIRARARASRSGSRRRTATRPRSPRRSASTSRATRTRTSRSAAAARTTAWARTSPSGRILFEELFGAARAIEPAGTPHWTVSGLHNNVPCSLGQVPIRVAA